MTEITAGLTASYFSPRPADSHKGTFGTALIIAGSERFPGAPILSARAALRSGCGLCVLASLPRVIESSLSAIPEAVFCFLEDDPSALDKPLDTCDAAACGMGLSQDKRAGAIVRAVLERCNAPLLLDADALNLIASRPELRKLAAERTAHGLPLVLTPHEGELARLTSTAVRGRDHAEELAASLASELRAIVVLKGHRTLVVTPDGNAFRNTTGNPGLARGGSGDALSGIVASLCARLSWNATSAYDVALNASLAGVFLHGLAADIASEKFTNEAMLPSDVIDALPAAFGHIAPVT